MNTILEVNRGTQSWPHAPPHRLAESGVYFVTARTVGREGFLDSAPRKDRVQAKLLELALQYGWNMEAWAILGNHYHFVALSPSDGHGESLRAWLRHLHADISREVNRLDGCPGRRLWHNYRDTHLTYEKSYLTRLAYTHFNPVHHGLVHDAAEYPWCSARQFAEEVSPAWFATVQSFRFEKVARDDGE